MPATIGDTVWGECALFRRSNAYKPFAFPFAVDHTQKHEDVHWTEKELSLGEDVTQWKSGEITPEEKHFIVQNLRLFTQSDVNVGGFYLDFLIPRILNNEVRLMLTSFTGREGTHQRAYSLINETLGLPESDYHAFLEYKEMADKHDHMLDADTTTVHGLLLAIAKGMCNEGISLFASFAMLLNFQRQGKMKGMGKAVEWSQRDETMHVEGLAWLFRQIVEAVPSAVTPELKLDLYNLFRLTVTLEDAYIDLAFAMGGITGLTAPEVKDYIRFIANRRMTQIGLKENWPGLDKNPLPWVDWLVAGADHTNFFEGKVTEYDVAGLTGDITYDTAPEPAGFLIFTKPDCPFCDEAKELLAEIEALTGTVTHSIELADPAYRDRFYKTEGFSGRVGPRGATMPKVFEVCYLGDERRMSDKLPGTRVLIGGAAELRRWAEDRKLLLGIPW